MHFTEDMFEQAVIELFVNMGYTHLYAPDLERDYSSPLLDSVLTDSLVKLNRGLPLDAINEAIAKLRNFDTGSHLQKNMQFMDYLQNGLPVKYFYNGEERNINDVIHNNVLVLFAAEDNVSYRKHNAERNDESVPTNIKLAEQGKCNFVQLNFPNAKTGE